MNKTLGTSLSLLCPTYATIIIAVNEKEQIPLDPPFSKWEAQDFAPPQDPNNKVFYSPL